MDLSKFTKAELIYLYKGEKKIQKGIVKSANVLGMLTVLDKNFCAEFIRFEGEELKEAKAILKETADCWSDEIKEYYFNLS